MLAVLLAAIGLAVLQPAEGEQQPIDVEIAELPEEDEAPGEAAEAERPAAPADRVVDEAGFPGVPQETEEAEETAPAPTVTINGRPLGVRTAENEEATTGQSSSEAAETEAEDEAGEQNEERDEPASATEDEDAQVAVVEPPMPRPRPADLPVKEASREIDYDAIAEAAYGGQNNEFMSREEREAIAPMPGDSGYGAVQAFDPRAEGLVEVVGPNGERVWVYQEQLESSRSGVRFQEGSAGNDHGFIYEEPGSLW